MNDLNFKLLVKANVEKFNLKSYLSNEIEEILNPNTTNQNEINQTLIWIDKKECILNIEYLGSNLVAFYQDKSIDFIQSNLNFKKCSILIKQNLIDNFNSDLHANLFLQNDLSLFKINVIKNLNFKSDSNDHKKNLELAYLSLFPIFEKCLGNVLFNLNNYNQAKIPFLLRDLVNDQLINEFFGDNLVNLIKILTFTPKSLNLRNLAWHGFLNPNQYNEDYVYFLIALISNINSKLKSKVDLSLLYKTRLKFNLKKVVSFLNDKNLELFKDFNKKFSIDYFSIIIEKSILIDDCRRNLWNLIFKNQSNLNNFSLMCLLLPEIEHILRKLYSIANNLSNIINTKIDNSSQIAQTNEFYLTIDDLLKFKNNFLINILDNYLLILIFDLFNYIDGPRLRDHLSHGDLESDEIDDFFLNILLFISIRLASYFIDDEIISDEFQIFCKSVCLNYEPNFHPIFCLKNEIINLIKNLSLYKKSISFSRSDAEIYEKVNEILSSKFVINNDNFVQDVLNKWKFFDLKILIYRYEYLDDINLSQIFRSRELQLINLFRFILKEIWSYQTLLEEKKKSNEVLKLSGNLRERQKNNLKSFFIFVQNFEQFFNLIIKMNLILIDNIIFSHQNLNDQSLIMEFYSLNNKDKLITKFERLVKYLKNVLKLIQNLIGYFNSNKWVESNDFIAKFENEKEFYLFIS